MIDSDVLTIAQVSKLLCRDPQTIRYLLDNKIVSWGMAYRRRGSKRKSYLIFKDKFQEETGIKISEREGVSE